MSLAAFGTLPPGVLTSPTPFTFTVPRSEQNHLIRLVHQADIAPPSYYNTHTDTTNTSSFGLSRDWLIHAQDVWTSPPKKGGFDWRAEQRRLNRYPNFRINVTATPSPSTSTSTSSSSTNQKDQGKTKKKEKDTIFDLHFAALFSHHPHATPLILMHGWPGAWFEFAPVLDLLAAKYTPATLPYHVIVPSIPDYGLSLRRNPRTKKEELERELTLDVAAGAMDGLMGALGFGGGYVAQGGDVGAFLAQVMCGLFEGCRAFHLNMYFMTEAQIAEVANIPITPAEQVQLERALAWVAKGRAYGNEHGTRPATISLVLSTNPLAMLAWMGEKFIEWSDNRFPIPLNTILSITSFYWFTGSFGRAMWPYRALLSIVGGGVPELPLSLTKPFGFSSFHIEISAFPRAWAEHLFPNLVFYNAHDKGGHFAALEQPELFLQDVEDFVALVAPNVTGAD